MKIVEVKPIVVSTPPSMRSTPCKFELEDFL